MHRRVGPEEEVEVIWHAVFWAGPSTALLNSQQLGLPAEDWVHKHSDLKEGKTHKPHSPLRIYRQLMVFISGKATGGAYVAINNPSAMFL